MFFGLPTHSSQDFHTHTHTHTTRLGVSVRLPSQNRGTSSQDIYTRDSMQSGAGHSMSKSSKKVDFHIFSAPSKTIQMALWDPNEGPLDPPGGPRARPSRSRRNTPRKISSGTPILSASYRPSIRVLSSHGHSGRKISHPRKSTGGRTVRFLAVSKHRQTIFGSDIFEGHFLVPPTYPRFIRGVI
jgi:hypothetical protein